ncbi:CHC2 zinc finger domain-containing protein [Porphyromonas pogonae]|uniref:CHC2 zinc finger domain-containing protein n=1 Tax=Porphyromonas pogonae TaxID=867595 RepID=UPI002E784EC3|nr:CHC2 zinc finger domain-containing protein [Porphyromonas pogonae]
MTNENIKRISIKDYLAHQGIYPAKERNGYGMYKSPFRDEKTASFKVDYKTNLWYDFGNGKGGSIIDLVMKMKQCSFIVATQILQKENHSFPFFHENSIREKATTALSISEIKPLENSQLLQFLQSRKINLNIAKAYCKEIHYQIGKRNYFAIDFPNDAGGYELRNPQFKGCIPPKEITTFDKKTPAVHLFEGFTDYLSLLTMQAKQADVSAIVLNSREFDIRDNRNDRVYKVL